MEASPLEKEEVWTEENAWSLTDDNDCWLYCDGAAYFNAFIAACEAARKHIFILGWDFHNATLLRPESADSSWRMDAFLKRLLQRRPELHIYLLIWDYASLYILEREKLPTLRMALMHHSHARVHFSLDSHHPFGGSHHEKVIVIDDQFACIGGIDLTVRRWDSCRHEARDPLRHDHLGEYYQPFHDTQLGLSGPAAEELGRLFRERWQKATGAEIPSSDRRPLQLRGAVISEAIASFKGTTVALSQTYPSYRDYPELRQILALYVTLISRAQRYVLIESQYLTSHPIVQVLCAVAAAPEGPEIVLILPERMGPWLENRAMTQPQFEALEQILAVNLSGRVHVLFPYDKELVAIHKYVTVHSKLMVIDDQFLTIGSANLNNRSMGLDSECNATIDARHQRAAQKQIREALAYLLAHYADHAKAAALEMLERGGSIMSVVDALALRSPDRHLARLSLRPQSATLPSWLDPTLLDMERPAALEAAMDRWGHMSENITRRLGLSPRLLSFLHSLVLLILTGWVLVFSHWTESSEPLTLHYLKILLEEHKSVLLLLFPLIYLIGCLLYFPINLLIIITASIFPLLWSWAFVLLGVTADALASYGLGRLVGRAFFKQFYGAQTARVLERIGMGEFAALVLLRIFPIAPHALLNLAAGAGRIPMMRFLGSTLLGMAPSTILLFAFQGSLLYSLRYEPWTSGLVLLVWGLTIGAAFRWLRRRFSNYGS